MALTAERSWLTGFANWKLLQYLGKISYGIYVYNLPLVGALEYVQIGSHWPRGVGLAVFVPLVVTNILLAHLSYRYFESWFLRKKAALRPLPSPDPSEETALGSIRI